MRPIRVLMQAFGPYASTQVVDFRELGENRFFLIHGPTGSGKTTVLDAMCYALYGTTTGAERSAEQMRSQFADDSLPTEVTFDFAIGEDCYRARRRPAQERAKSRGAGTTVVPAEARLWKRPAGLADEDDGTPLAVKAREMGAEVTRIIGFDADQFRQVIMLPQGRFRELLSADSKKREDIMQALFGTGRYAGVEMALKRRKADVGAGIAQARALRVETLAQAGAESDDQLGELEQDAACELTTASGVREAAQETARATAKAAEAGRGAAARLAAAETARVALGEADAELEEASVARDAAVSVYADETAREPERAAAESALRDLEALAAASGDLAAAQAAVGSARSQRDERRARHESAAQALTAARASLEAARTQVREGAQAEADLVAAQTVLEASEASLEAISRRIAVDDRVAAATAAVAEARERAEGARRRERTATISRDAVMERWRAGRASALAATLVPGEPCPVCGATDHPAPACAALEAPSDEDVDAVEEALRAAADACATAATHLAEAEAALAGLSSEARTLRDAGAVGDMEQAHSALERAREQREQAALRVQAVRDAAERTIALQAEVASCEKAVEEARQALAAAEGDVLLAERTVSEVEARVPADLRDPAALATTLADARRALRELTDAHEAARTRAAQADTELVRIRERRTERATALESAQREADGVTAPDLDALESAAREAANARDAAIETAARLSARCAAFAKARARLAELDARSGELLARYETVAAIADAATGANPAKLSFQRYVLGVFLTEVLQAATRRLEVMTRGRYRLHMAAGPHDRRSASGLELEVFDEYTGEDRSVATLSGGEGFLASLALALGLAEVVESLAGGIHLDTVFIDEGFGTLDEEALETAIDALMELQGRSRLVGIISHVAELKAVVPARLEVTSTPSGSSARFVVP